VHDSFIIHHALKNELQKAMDKAFSEMFGVKCKIDLKYNSIEERQKEEGGEPEECDVPIRELFEGISERGEYGTYFRLLNQHRRYFQKQSSNTQRIPSNSE
jgi:hypothetical protein